MHRNRYEQRWGREACLSGSMLAWAPLLLFGAGFLLLVSSASTIPSAKSCRQFSGIVGEDPAKPLAGLKECIFAPARADRNPLDPTNDAKSKDPNFPK